MLNFLKNSFFVNPNKKILNNYKLLLDKVNNLEGQIKLLSDLQIKNKTNDLKQNLKNGKKLDDILPDAFALVNGPTTKLVLGNGPCSQILTVPSGVSIYLAGCLLVFNKSFSFIYHFLQDQYLALCLGPGLSQLSLALKLFLALGFDFLILIVFCPAFFA